MSVLRIIFDKGRRHFMKLCTKPHKKVPKLLFKVAIYKLVQEDFLKQKSPVVEMTTHYLL